jgi:hypothetical protein
MAATELTHAAIDCIRTCTCDVRSDQIWCIPTCADAAGHPRTCASIAALQRTQIYQWALVSGAPPVAPLISLGLPGLDALCGMLLSDAMRC